LGSTWLRGHRQLTENPSNFSTPDCKKINWAPSVRVIVICSDHKLLWLDSYKGVYHALTIPDESKLHARLLLLLLDMVLIQHTFQECLWIKCMANFSWCCNFTALELIRQFKDMWVLLTDTQVLKFWASAYTFKHELILFSHTFSLSKKIFFSGFIKLTLIFSI